MDKLTNILPRSGHQTSTVLPGLNKNALLAGNPKPQENFVSRQRPEVGNSLVRLTTRQDVQQLQGLGRSARLQGSTGYVVLPYLKRVIAQSAEVGSFDRKAAPISRKSAAEARGKWMANAEKALSTPGGPPETKGLPAGTKGSPATPVPAKTPPLAQREEAWLVAAQSDRNPENTPQPQQAARQAALTREALVTQLRTELAAARAAKPQNDTKIEQCASAAIKACLPEIFSAQTKEAPGVVAAMQKTLVPLMALDARLAAAKTPGYSIDRMLDVVCNFASIRNHDPAHTAQSAADALGELEHSLNGILTAISPPRDGADLDHLVGLSTELDAALFAARVTATANLMLGETVDNKQESKAVPSRRQAQATADATSLVQQQFDLAKTRLRLQNTLRTQGIPQPPGSLHVGHLDTDKVRRQLGRNADKVGLILDAIKIQQEKIKASPEAASLSTAIDETLDRLDNELPAGHQNMVYLAGRLSQLPTRPRAQDHVIDIKDPQDGKYPDDVVIDIKAPPKPAINPADELTLRLVRDGMASNTATAETYKAINQVMAQARPQLDHFDVAIVAGGKDEDKAQRLGDALLRKLLNKRDDPKVSVKTANQTATAHAMKAALGPRLGDCKLSVPAAAISDLQEEIAGLSDELSRLDGLKASARAVLREHGIDSARPGGLRSCIKVREALRCLQQIEMGGDNAPQARTDLDRLCAELRDFIPRTLKSDKFRNSETEPAFTREHLEKLARDPRFAQAVEALIFVRESDAQENGLLLDVANGLNTMGQQLAQRRKDMGEASHAVLRDAVRAAILHVATGSTSLSWFQPADKVKEITALLKDWGVPVETFQPEINALLSESFGPDELNVWLEEASDPVQATSLPQSDGKGLEPTGIESKGTRSAQRNDLASEEDEPPTAEDFGAQNYWPVSPPSTRTSEEARQAILDSIDRLQLSSRVRLTGGYRAALNSGSIKVADSKVGLGGRLVGSKVLSFEIGRGADAYEVVLRDGWDVRAGLSGIHNLGSIPNVPVTGKVEGAWSADGVYNPNGGVMLRFPNDDKGRELVKKTLTVLIDKDPIEPGDLPEGVNVCKFDESRVQGKAGGGARAGVEFNMTEPAGLGKQGVITGTLPAFMASGRLAGAGQYQYTNQQAMSHNGGVRRTFRETTLESTLGVVGTLRTGSRALGGGHSVSGDAIEAGKWAGWTLRDRTKVVLDANGMVIGSTEIDRSVFMPPGGPAMMRRLAPPAFKKLMESLESSTEPARQRLASDINALIKGMKTNQLFSMVSGLDPRVAAAINRKKSEANALRTGMIPSRSGVQAEQRAMQLERQAQAMLDDEGNYFVHRIRVMDQYDNLSSKTYVDLGMLRVSHTDEHMGTTPVADARPTPELSREIHDLGSEVPLAQAGTPPEWTGTRSGIKGPITIPTQLDQQPLSSTNFETKADTGKAMSQERRESDSIYIYPSRENRPITQPAPLSGSSGQIPALVSDAKQSHPASHAGMVRADFALGAVPSNTQLTIGRPNGAGNAQARFVSVSEPHREQNAIWVEGPVDLLPQAECLSIAEGLTGNTSYYLIRLDLHTVNRAT